MIMSAPNGSLVHLEEVAEKLAIYATALSKRNVTIVAQDFSSQDISKRTSTSKVKDGICLDEKLDSGTTREETLLEYRINTTLEALILGASYEVIDESKLRKAKVLVSVKDGFINLENLTIDKPKGYRESFFSLFRAIEIGRIRQKIKEDYPKLSEDIDLFIGKKLGEKVKDTIKRYKCIKDEWKKYAKAVFADPLQLSLRNELVTEQEAENEIFYNELSYALLFSDNNSSKREIKFESEYSEELYDKVFEIINKPNASRTDSIILTLEILEKLKFKPRAEQPIIYRPDYNDERRKREALEDAKILGKDHLLDVKLAKELIKNENIEKFGTETKPIGMDEIIPITSDARARLRNLDIKSETVEVIRKGTVIAEPKNIEMNVDEWDFEKRIYLRKTCKITERDKFMDIPGTVKRTPSRTKFSAIEVAQIEEALQILKPEGKVKTNVPRSGKFDFDKWVRYIQSKKIGLNPKPRFYLREEMRDRDVAQLLLWDISGSSLGYCSESAIKENMRIIDMEEYGILHYAAAARSLGDDLVILAYNSRGRNNVSIYRLLDFGEDIDLINLAKKLMKVNPCNDNHDGAAIRYALQRYLLNNQAETKILVHISDGLPKDTNFSGVEHKEYSGKYAIEDTKKALDECDFYGVKTFCLSFVKETHREALRELWKDKYKMLKTPYSLGKKLAEAIIENTFV